MKQPVVFIEMRLVFYHPSGCWSTAPHAVVLTHMREHYYCVYLYMLCWLMY